MNWKPWSKEAMKMDPNSKKFAEMKKEMETNIRFSLPENIMARYNPDIHASSDKADDESTINMYDVIGYDYWTGGGVTEKLVSAVLRKNKGKDITVNINSPGGDFFTGVAIYHMLKEHDGDVTVRVVGMAASAASVIAMAGTNIKIGKAAFLMIHNAWHLCIGNRNDMRDAADTLNEFDAAMQGVYSDVTGIDKTEIEEMMDAETWIGGEKAVDLGFATEYLDSDEIEVDEEAQASHDSNRNIVDAALASVGKSRSERRKILKDLTGTPSATVKTTTPSAGNDDALVEALSKFNSKLETIKT